jgi:dolichol-phosphate mannosyltransferase
VNLTRNFGHQAAVSAGLSLARGDAVVVMDCDLQDPPELLPRLIERWRDGFHVVYGVRKKRKEWIGKRVSYWAFYRLLARISDLDIPLDSGDFCLMDRSVIELLEQLPERQRFVRGLRTWVGLRQTGIEYERPARAAGEPAYTLRGLVKLAMDGLVSFSSVPLRVVTRIGVLAAVLAMAMGAWVVWSVLTGQPMPRGWASLACLVLLTAAVQLISLGIIGEYLARVFLEVKRRPTYLIASVIERDAAPHRTIATRWQGRAHRGTPPDAPVITRERT